MDDTICAISTAPTSGAISIVRVSGKQALEYVSKIADIDLKKVKSHTIHYGHVVNKNEIIDEVLFMIMLAPKTYTKEDIIEINCHGGLNTTQKVLALLLEKGCRLAEPGEFTKRAFLNGRIDLTQAEAVNDLIFAKSDAARKMAITNVDGKLFKQIKTMRESISKILANIEVNIDYPEYIDEVNITREMMEKYLNKILDELTILLENSKSTHILKEGINIAIIGKPNVGKSSLLNTLIDEEKAIVTNIPGTTRDIVEGSIFLNGIKINLIDTAGIRNTKDVVEKIGVKKSKSIAENADLIIIVLNNNELLIKEERDLLDLYPQEKIIVFVNKNDLDSKLILPHNNNYDVVMGNTLSTDGLKDLKNKIITKMNINTIQNKDLSYLANIRQVDLVSKSIKSIKTALNNLKMDIPIDILEIDLKNAWDYLGEIIGSSYTDELVDTIFSNFCLGK